MLSVAPMIPKTELDDATLRRAQHGDDAAARELVLMYQDRVFALASRMLSGRGRASVEDVAQDTFLAVFRQLAGFSSSGPAKLSSWILTIAARRAIDEVRRQRPMLLAEPERDRASDARGDERAMRRELALKVEAALRELTPEHRAAFLLREYHGLEYAEIARALSIDLGTVKSRIARARARLRELLVEVSP